MCIKEKRGGGKGLWTCFKYQYPRITPLWAILGPLWTSIFLFFIEIRIGFVFCFPAPFSIHLTRITLHWLSILLLLFSCCCCCCWWWSCPSSTSPIFIVFNQSDCVEIEVEIDAGFHWIAMMRPQLLPVISPQSSFWLLLVVAVVAAVVAAVVVVWLLDLERPLQWLDSLSFIWLKSLRVVDGDGDVSSLSLRPFLLLLLLLLFPLFLHPPLCSFIYLYISFCFASLLMSCLCRRWLFWLFLTLCDCVVRSGATGMVWRSSRRSVGLFLLFVSAPFTNKSDRFGSLSSYCCWCCCCCCCCCHVSCCPWKPENPPIAAHLKHFLKARNNLLATFRIGGVKFLYLLLLIFLFGINWSVIAGLLNCLSGFLPFPPLPLPICPDLSDSIGDWFRRPYSAKRVNGGGKTLKRRYLVLHLSRCSSKTLFQNSQKII